MAKEVKRIDSGIAEDCMPCQYEEGKYKRAVVQIEDAEDEEGWKTYMCGNHAEVLDPETYSPYYPAKDPRRHYNK